MSAERRVYVTVGDYRLGALHRPGDDLVMVWDARSQNGSAVMYKIDRFRDSKLTEATLKELFTGKE